MKSLNFMSYKISTRILLITFAAIAGAVAINYAIFIKGYREDSMAMMVEKAAAFTATANNATQFASEHLIGADAYDREMLERDYKETRAAGLSYRHSKIFKTLPFIVGWSIGEKSAKDENIMFNAIAFEARNERNAPESGSFEEALLEDLHTQAKDGAPGGDADVLHRVNTETNNLHYVRAIRITQDCLSCHGDPATSPTADGRDILGFEMEDWEVGKIHGAYHVTMPLEPMDANIASFISSGLMYSVPAVALILVAFAFVLRRIFGRPVNDLISRMQDLAEGDGDLTKRIHTHSNDELGALSGWVNQFVTKVHDVIAEVIDTTREVANSAGEIATASDQISGGMTQQSEQIHQVSAAIEEMSASVVEVAKKSTEAASHADSSGEIAKNGGLVVQDTVQGMTVISEAVSSSATSVEELGKRSQQIGEIVGVINEIADQTNLLALNAAIESARAGEHGRGFAVVADEVRKLADRTTHATEEIAESIAAIQEKTTQAVQRMTAGSDEVNRGVVKASEAGDSLEQIVTSATGVSSMIQSIAAAAEEQAAASEQVARNVEHISGITTQSTAATTEAAQAANEMARRSRDLFALLETFTVNNNGKHPSD